MFTERIKKNADRIFNILSGFDCDVPACAANAYRLLHHGRLNGTGRIVILPVDQGFEHGPDKSFALNEAGYDPEYHVQLAIDAGLNGYAAPLGMLEMIARKYAGMIPLILKMNSNNLLNPSDSEPSQAIYSAVHDAVRLGCIGVGLTIYPGSEHFNASIREITNIISDAKKHGLLVFIWAYPRGRGISLGNNSSLGITCYAAHIAAQLGAHVIKVKFPDEKDLSLQSESRSHLVEEDVIKRRSKLIQCVMKSSFAAKKIVLFSGGVNRNLYDIYSDVKSINIGGGHGSIIGRNAFQRPYSEAIDMLSNILNIYSGN